MTKRKNERRAEERERAAREQAVLRKAGTLSPLSRAAAPGTAGPGSQEVPAAAGRQREAGLQAPPRENRPRVPLQQAFAAALAAALAGRAAWDEPAVLYTVHHGQETCRLQLVRLPPGRWLQDVILSLAMTISAGPPVPAPPGILGVAVRHRGWALLHEDMTPDQRRRAVTGHGRPVRPDLAPNRTAARVIYGVDTTGTGYHVQQARGRRQEAFIFPPGGKDALLGEVPNALRCFLDAMTARQPQPREPGR